MSKGTITSHLKDRLKKGLFDKQKKAKKLKQEIEELSRFPISIAQRETIAQTRLEYGEKQRELAELYMEKELEILKGNLPILKPK